MGKFFFLLIALIGGVFANTQEDEVVFKHSSSERQILASTLSGDYSGSDYNLFLSGYLQSIVDQEFLDYRVLVVVQDKEVKLFNLPENTVVKQSILSFVKSLEEIEGREVSEVATDHQQNLSIQKHVMEQRPGGVWFPNSVLYRPVFANPMGPFYTLKYQSGDNDAFFIPGLAQDDLPGKSVVAISLGDIFPIYRWTQVTSSDFDVQLSIEACMWGWFNMKAPQCDPCRNEWAELITTDYMLGIPLTIAKDQYAVRFRVYHISSHLGDEYICNHSDVVCLNGNVRVNPSMEAVDIFLSYHLNDYFRVVVGPGVVFHSDTSYELKPMYFEWGIEARRWNNRSKSTDLYSTPFISTYFRNWQENNFRLDASIMVGWEWSRLENIGRNFRVFAQYFNGYSTGQFFKETTSYWSVGVSYGY